MLQVMIDYNMAGQYCVKCSPLSPTNNKFATNQLTVNVDTTQFDRMMLMTAASLATVLAGLAFFLLTTFLGMIFFIPGVLTAAISPVFDETGLVVTLIIGIILMLIGSVILLPNISFFGFWMVVLIVLGCFLGGVGVLLFMIVASIGGSGSFIIGVTISIIVAIVSLIFVVSAVAFISIIGLLVFGVVGGLPLLFFSPLLLVVFLFLVGLALVAFTSFAFVALFILLVILSPLLIVASPIVLWVLVLIPPEGIPQGELVVGASNPQIADLFDVFLGYLPIEILWDDLKLLAIN